MSGKEGKSIGTGGMGQRMLQDSHGSAPASGTPGIPPCRLWQDTAHLHARQGLPGGKLQKGEKMLFL